jgi:hypothetical protein
MKAILFISIAIILGFESTAQRSINSFPGSVNNSLELMQDGWGRPMYLKTEYNFVGSPFWPEAYQIANLTIKNGAQYQGVQVKVNLLTNLVLFKANDGSDMEVTAEVRTIAFSDTTSDMKNVVLMSGFPNVDAQTAASFYQLLDSGNTKLLKTYAVSFDEKTQYGYAGVTRELVKKPVYYLYLADGSMKKLEKGKNALLKLFPDKTTAIEDYLKKEKLKLQKEAEFIKVIAYLNSLPVTN